MLRILALLSVLADPAFAADMPVKAAPIPFVYGYSGKGFYKFIGTELEANDSVTALGNVNTFGGAIGGGVGYQWSNPGNSTFTAIELDGVYHNLGGSNVVGALTSRWSAGLTLKFGGPIANVLQWLPAGVSMPVLPALGNAVGASHVYIGGGGKLEDATGTVIGVSKHNIDGKGFLTTGIIQQYCTAPTSCLAMDTYFKFTPAQSGFSVLGTQQNLGKGYTAGIHLVF